MTNEGGQHEVNEASREVALGLLDCNQALARVLDVVDGRRPFTTMSEFLTILGQETMACLARGSREFTDSQNAVLGLLHSATRVSGNVSRPLEATGGTPSIYLIVPYIREYYDKLKTTEAPDRSRIATLLHLYIASTKPYSSNSMQPTSSMTLETLSNKQYVSAVQAAVASVISLSGCYVHTHHYYGLFEVLVSFHDDLHNLKSIRAHSIRPLLTQSTLAISHCTTMINTRCLQFGETLWNVYTFMPAFVILYIALRHMKLVKGSIVLDAVIKHLLRMGPKGMLTRGVPTKDFAKYLTVVTAGTELKKTKDSSGKVCDNSRRNLPQTLY